MTLRLARLPSSFAIVDSEGRPSAAFQRWWQTFVGAIEANEGSQDALIAAVAAAQAAANDAQAAADTAQTAADTASTAADGANSVAAITNSGVSGATITGTDAGANVTVSISGHTRLYGDGTNVAVTGGSVTGLAYSTLYFIYYDQPSRAGGSVTYLATTSEATAAQTGDRHLVGSVMTPAALAAPTDGDYVRPPGVGGIIP